MATQKAVKKDFLRTSAVSVVGSGVGNAVYLELYSKYRSPGDKREKHSLRVKSAEAEDLKNLFRYAIEQRQESSFYKFIGDGSLLKKSQHRREIGLNIYNNQTEMVNFVKFKAEANSFWEQNKFSRMLIGQKRSNSMDDEKAVDEEEAVVAAAADVNVDDRDLAAGDNGMNVGDGMDDRQDLAAAAADDDDDDYIDDDRDMNVGDGMDDRQDLAAADDNDVDVDDDDDDDDNDNDNDNDDNDDNDDDDDEDMSLRQKIKQVLGQRSRYEDQVLQFMELTRKKQYIKLKQMFKVIRQKKIGNNIKIMQNNLESQRLHISRLESALAVAEQKALGGIGSVHCKSTSRDEMVGEVAAFVNVDDEDVIKKLSMLSNSTRKENCQIDCMLFLICLLIKFLKTNYIRTFPDKTYRNENEIEEAGLSLPWKVVGKDICSKLIEFIFGVGICPETFRTIVKTTLKEDYSVENCALFVIQKPGASVQTVVHFRNMQHNFTKQANHTKRVHIGPKGAGEFKTVVVTRFDDRFVANANKIYKLLNDLSLYAIYHLTGIRKIQMSLSQPNEVYFFEPRKSLDTLIHYHLKYDKFFTENEGVYTLPLCITGDAAPYSRGSTSYFVHAFKVYIKEHAHSLPKMQEILNNVFSFGSATDTYHQHRQVCSNLYVFLRNIDDLCRNGDYYTYSEGGKVIKVRTSISISADHKYLSFINGIGDSYYCLWTLLPLHCQSYLKVSEYLCPFKCTAKFCSCLRLFDPNSVPLQLDGFMPYCQGTKRLMKSEDLSIHIKEGDVPFLRSQIDRHSFAIQVSNIMIEHGFNYDTKYFQLASSSYPKTKDLMKESILAFDTSICTLFKEKDEGNQTDTEDYIGLLPLVVEKAKLNSVESVMRRSKKARAPLDPEVALKKLLTTFCLHFDDVNKCFDAVRQHTNEENNSINIESLGKAVGNFLSEDLEHYSRVLHKLRDDPMHFINPEQSVPCILHFGLRSVVSLLHLTLQWMLDFFKDDSLQRDVFISRIKACLGQILGKQDPSHYLESFNLDEGLQISLNGNECRLVMSNIDKLLKVFFDTEAKREESSENMRLYKGKTYSTWFTLLKTCYLDGIWMKLRDREIDWRANLAECKSFKENCEMLRTLFLKFFSKGKVTVYLQLLFNGVILQLLKHHRNLAIYDQQDFERQHLIIKLNIRRKSNQKRVGLHQILWFARDWLLAVETQRQCFPTSPDFKTKLMEIQGLNYQQKQAILSGAEKGYFTDSEEELLNDLTEDQIYAENINDHLLM